MTDATGNILLVEDDASIRRSLKATLSAMGYKTGEASSGEDALRALRLTSFDVVLMDLNMPGMGGVEACRRVRHEFQQMSILVLTVKDSEEDKIQALDAGADDYITKPFQIRELTARIRAALRRSQSPTPQREDVVRVGIFELHPARRLLKKRDQEVRLTPTEFDLILYFMSHRGRPVMHAKLLSSVWGPEYGNEREYLRTFIMQLRKKLEDEPSAPVYLKTVAHFGYVFSEPTAEDATAF